MHELHVLLAHAALDGWWHLDLVWLAAYCQLRDVFHQLTILVQGVHALIKKDVCVPPALLPPVGHALHHVVEYFAHVLSSKALVFHLFVIVHLALCDIAIVEFVPAIGFALAATAVPLDDVRVVVTATGLA